MAANHSTPISGSDVEHGSDMIFIVDDDPLVRATLEAILSLAGFKSVKFASAQHFLTHITSRHSGCALVDVRMPDMDGLALQEELVRRNASLSVIIMTGHADVPLAVEAMRRGALDILEKPIDRGRLIARIQSGLAMARDKAERAAQAEAVKNRLAELSTRERDILRQIIAGHSNKEVARILNISSRTVEIHRARVMKKMKAESVASLVRMTADLL